jgi:hypothetical protein
LITVQCYGGQFKNLDCPKKYSTTVFFDGPNPLPQGTQIQINWKDQTNNRIMNQKILPGDTISCETNNISVEAFFEYRGTRFPLKIPDKATRFTYKTSSPIACQHLDTLILDASLMPAYLPTPASDTLVVIKLKGYSNRSIPAYQPEGLGGNIRFKRKGKTYQLPFLNFPHTLLLPEGKEVTTFGYDDVKTKFRKRKKIMKLKVVKKKLDKVKAG